MKRLFGKLGFAHRYLWQRDGLYRAAVCFGPAPALGCAIAFAIWGGASAWERQNTALPQWATNQAPPQWSVDGQMQSIEPNAPLPATDENGGFTGYVSGWNASAEPILVNQALDVDVLPTPLTSYVLNGPGIDMNGIIAGGPAAGLYVGIGSGFLAIRTAGTYAVSARLERPAGPPADCLVRLGFGPRRIVSNLDVDVANDFSHTFDPAQFSLQAGLYQIVWAFGCWQGQQVIGPGKFSILIGHADHQALQPVEQNEIFRRN